MSVVSPVSAFADSLRMACLFLAALAGVPGPLSAQESRPASAPAMTSEAARANERAFEILKASDQRIYYAREATTAEAPKGIEDLALRWRATGQGALGGIDLWMLYRWKIGKAPVVEPRAADMSSLEKLPEYFDKNPAEYTNFCRSMIGTVESRLLGKKNAEVYESWYKTVSEREVNNKIETRIDMVPPTKKLWARVILNLRDGLPYEEIKVTEAGNEFHGFFRWEKLGDRFLMKGYRTEVANTLKDEEEYSYIVQKGVTVLSQIERRSMIPNGPPLKTTIKFEDITINQGIPDRFFQSK